MTAIVEHSKAAHDTAASPALAELHAFLAQHQAAPANALSEPHKSTAPASATPAPIIAIHGVGDFEHGAVIGPVAGSPVFSKVDDFRRQTLFLGNAMYTLLEDDVRVHGQAASPRFLEVNWSDIRKPMSTIMGLLSNFFLVVLTLLRIGVNGVDLSPSLRRELWFAPFVRYGMALLMCASLLPVLSALLWKVDVGTRFGLGLAVGLGVVLAARAVRKVSPELWVLGSLFGVLCAVTGWYTCYGVVRVQTRDVQGMLVGSQVLDQPGRDMVSAIAGAVHSWVVIIVAVVFLLAALEVLRGVKWLSLKDPRNNYYFTRLGCLWLPVVLFMLAQPVTVSAVLLSMNGGQQEAWGMAFEVAMPFPPHLGQLTGAVLAGALLLTLLIGAVQYLMVTRLGRNGTWRWCVGVGLAWLLLSLGLENLSSLSCQCCAPPTAIGVLGAMLVISGIATYQFYRANDDQLYRELNQSRERASNGKVWHASGGVARWWIAVMLKIYPLLIAPGVVVLMLYAARHLGFFDFPLLDHFLASLNDCKPAAREVHADQAYLQTTKYAVALLPLATKPFANLLDALGDVFYFVVDKRPEEKRYADADASLQTREVTQDRLALAIKNMLAHSPSQRVVILAHSQGTVITASLLDKVSDALSRTPFRIDVITIGSPLTSLYLKFFDVSLGQRFAQLCQQQAQQFSWQNICRRADYVGSEVQHAGITNLALQTPGDHVKYWDDPVLLRHLAAVSAGAPLPEQAEIVRW